VDVGGKLILAGGAITDNVSGTAGDANGHGGGVWLDNYADFIMESGTIGGNYVYGQGGGVCMDFGAHFTMKGGEIFRNTAWAASSGARGGGVYNLAGTFRMSGGKINGYAWEHGTDPNVTEHFRGEQRDDCNVVIVGTAVMPAFGAALYSDSGDNFYGTFAGETFTKTGEFGTNIHVERDIEIADGVRLNRFDVNGETVQPWRGAMNYYGPFFNASTENLQLGIASIYNEGLVFDMLLPRGSTRLVAGTYTFTASTESSWNTLPAFTFTDNEYTSFVQDAEGGRLKITGGTVKVVISGTGDTAVYTIAVDCTLDGGGTAKGTYRGTLTWYDESGE
jgi:hypothetical protein